MMARISTRSFVEWMFRSRETGRIVVAQAPNTLLLVWLAAAALRWIFQPDGTWRTAVALVAAIALTIWSLDEILRGVNPFRRILGLTVLAGLVASWLHG